jgi:hypothetical protein
MTRRQIKGLSEVVAEGKYSESLVALRDHLAQELENAPAGIAIGPIVNQLRMVLAELDSLRVPEVSSVDEIAKRRADRLAKAASQ